MIYIYWRKYKYGNTQVLFGASDEVDLEAENYIDVYY
jgi:hypothetical protein